MKKEVKRILKEQGNLDFYTDLRFDLVKSAMKDGIKKDDWLKNYLSLDPLNKAQWVADNIVRIGKIALGRIASHMNINKSL